MATRIAWLLNFDATDELADPARYSVTRLSPARMREVMALFLDLVAPDDVLLDEETLRTATTAQRAAFTAQAFCPTPSALSRIVACGHAPPDAPSLEILRRVSDRAFCAELGHGLPGAAFVRDMHALHAALQRPSFTGSHVIKRAFSFAGREQRRVHAGELDDSTRGFCERSFARGEGVQVEPWVSRLLDVSLHGYLTRSGDLLSGQPRTQRCDPMGRFIGMQPDALGLTLVERDALHATLEETAGALETAGYFGPFGIDAFRYAGPDGEPRCNTRCEINARFTMGYPRELLLRGLAAG